MDINSPNRISPIEQVGSQRDAAEPPSVSPTRRPMDRTSSPLPPCAATQGALVVPRLSSQATTKKQQNPPKMGPDTARDICMVAAAANMVEEGFLSNLDCSGPQAVGARLKQVCAEALETLHENKPEAELWRQLERVRKAIQTAVESMGGSQYDSITSEDPDDVVSEQQALLYAMHRSDPELLREMIAHDLEEFA